MISPTTIRCAAAGGYTAAIRAATMNSAKRKTAVAALELHRL